MATGYEKINAIKSKLKVKQTVNSLAYLMGCGPRTIFRHLEVETLSGQAKENAKKNIDAYFTFLSKEKKEAAAHFANLYVQGTYPKAVSFMARECQILTMTMVMYVKSIR